MCICSAIECVVGNLRYSEPESIDSESSNPGDQHTEQLFMVLSKTTISGSDAPRTLKIRGQIQHMELLVLIDSDSSNSFISAHATHQLEGVTPAGKPMRV
jgi:hypothetical protein